MGTDGDFCKHCVATALTWLSRAKVKMKKGKKVTLADVEKMLQAEDHATLVRMVMDWAKKDGWLHERLILQAARHSGPDASVAAAKRAFENAVNVDDYAGYGEASDWARGVDEAIDSIEQLLTDGQAGAVIGLCESALLSLVDAIQQVDDSGGEFAPLQDRLEAIHHSACWKAKPNQEELAIRLFEYEMHGDFDIFFDSAARYSRILGAKGMKAYRELAEAEWAKVPAKTAKTIDAGLNSHFHITHIMESLAQKSGDLEQLVAVKSRDLSSASNYLNIAEVYREAKQYDNALLWVERGLKSFPKHTGIRLREFAAEEYHRRRRHDDAMKVIWAEFLERPYSDTYKTLERHAKKAGAWPEWRERALTEIRRSAAKADRSTLVEIFLYERDIESAWREAQDGGCAGHLWLQLAAARESSHPEDAAPIYLKQAEAALAGSASGDYEEPVQLLVKAASAMKRMGHSAEFVKHLDALRATHKRRRNFIALLEKKRKSLYLSHL